MSDPIASLRALHEEATEAPWRRGDNGPITERALYSPRLDGYVRGLLCAAPTDRSNQPRFVHTEDARLVVAMRNNFRALLDAAVILRDIRRINSARTGRPLVEGLADVIDAVLSRLHVEDTP